jgi:hypothetical protein
MRASAMDVGEFARMAADNRSCVICTPAIHGGRLLQRYQRRSCCTRPGIGVVNEQE